MARNDITLKFVGMDKFKAQCEDVKEQLDELEKAINKLPWYVRAIIAFKTTVRLTNEKSVKG